MEKQTKIKFARVSALDLVVLMDCTGSMKPWVSQAKDSIISIVQDVKKDHTNAHVRVGFVAYRDFYDGSNRLQVKDLTDDIEAVRKFIGSLKAFGGGDGPEDIPGALEAALN